MPRLERKFKKVLQTDTPDTEGLINGLRSLRTQKLHTHHILSYFRILADGVYTKSRTKHWKQYPSMRCRLCACPNVDSVSHWILPKSNPTTVQIQLPENNVTIQNAESWFLCTDGKHRISNDAPPELLQLRGCEIINIDGSMIPYRKFLAFRVFSKTRLRESFNITFISPRCPAVEAARIKCDVELPLVQIHAPKTNVLFLNAVRQTYRSFIEVGDHSCDPTGRTICHWFATFNTDPQKKHSSAK